MRGHAECVPGAVPGSAAAGVVRGVEVCSSGLWTLPVNSGARIGRARAGLGAVVDRGHLAGMAGCLGPGYRHGGSGVDGAAGRFRRGRPMPGKSGSRGKKPSPRRSGEETLTRFSGGEAHTRFSGGQAHTRFGAEAPTRIGAVALTRCSAAGALTRCSGGNLEAHLPGARAVGYRYLPHASDRGWGRFSCRSCWPSSEWQ